MSVGGHRRTIDLYFEVSVARRADTKAGVLCATRNYIRLSYCMGVGGLRERNLVMRPRFRCSGKMPGVARHPSNTGNKCDGTIK